MEEQPRIICVSNRLPVSAQEDSEGITFQPSTGGLVSALGPILRKSSGMWIGWPGAVAASDLQISKSLEGFSDQSEFELFPVILDQDAVKGFYEGFSNSIIWPLFHDLQTRCNFEPDFWSTYLEVQEKFCLEVYKHIRPLDLVWVQDYHLLGLGRALRRRKIKNKFAFFFHTPFPSPDIFLKLPWRSDVMDSMLSYDIIGFQTQRDLKNFVECIDVLTDAEISKAGEHVNIKTQTEECILGSFPISVDFNEIEEIALSVEVALAAEKIRNDMNVEFLVLSIDRLDYTKGIPDRIKAFQKLLELDSTLTRRIGLLQVVVPSRIEVPEYQLLRSEIEQLVTQVNGKYGEPGWVPVHHLFRSLTKEEVISMYSASDVALVTPLKDGMNLVCKEFCAAKTNNAGALVLSEFAGAAVEFKDFAFLVNPYDIEGVAKVLREALAVSKSSNNERMKGLREKIRNSDVFYWAESFLNAADWKSHSPDQSNRSTKIWERLKRITNVFDI